MYECPSCGANIKYDIASGQMLCAHCSTRLDPYACEKERDAYTEKYFDTVIHTCPQCAGQLICEDTEAAVFCPYCGGSTIISDRINQVKRPTGIVPFAKTKEECKEAYKKRMKRAIYAPGELKKADYIDGFRGIYMPYWDYQIEQKGEFYIPSNISYQSGNYYIKEHYDLTGTLDAEFEGIHFDASSAFGDDLGERIAPFYIKEAKKFTPSFLSGYYADIPDVPEEVYEKAAKEVAQTITAERIRNERVYDKFKMDEIESSNSCLELMQCKNVNSLMLPVWFMSHKYGDRMTYAVVNGQTGKVAIDIPVDFKKFWIGTLLISLPIFLFLNLFFTFKPELMLGIILIIAMFGLKLYESEIREVALKESKVTDAGYCAANLSAKQRNDLAQKKNSSKKKKIKMELNFVNVVFFILGILLFFAIVASVINSSNFMGNLVLILRIGSWILLIWAFFIIRSIGRIQTTILELKKKRNYWVLFVTMLIVCIVLLLKPVFDSVYYGAAIICTVTMCYALMDLIHYYNILATRRPPQFNRQGGDDDA